MVDNFHIKAGIFCAICGEPAAYYSFKSKDKDSCIQGYNCPNIKCTNDNVIEDYMTNVAIHKSGFVTKEVVIFRD